MESRSRELCSSLTLAQTQSAPKEMSEVSELSSPLSQATAGCIGMDFAVCLCDSDVIFRMNRQCLPAVITSVISLTSALHCKEKKVTLCWPSFPLSSVLAKNKVTCVELIKMLRFSQRKSIIGQQNNLNGTGYNPSRKDPIENRKEEARSIINQHLRKGPRCCSWDLIFE